MRDALRAGIAIYNDGHHHAAHDAWEARWLELEADTDDERLLHGLIQFTAAVYHANRRNWEGSTGLAESAGTYLGPLSPAYRGVNVAPVRDFLETLATDPAVIERRPPLALTHEGTVLRLADLTPGEIFIAAGVLAEELGEDEAMIDRAIAFAREDLTERDSSRLLALLVDFTTDADNRRLIVDRLEAHVDRRQQRREDVDGLFEP